jgi:Flp pilus assembly protein TadG
MPSERRRALDDRDSGAVAVETALVSLLLLTLIFGIVETSFLFKDWLTVSTAARAGARMGSSEPRMLNFAQDSADQVTNSMAGLNTGNIQQVWVYRTTGTTGSPPASCTSSFSCVPFTWVGSKLTTTLSANWPNTSQNACAGDPARDAVGVYVKYKHAGLGFFFTNAIVAESTVMWLEPTTAAICKP